jgi:2-C-methyl-D-erythritol 4-phosphate cytidylyltransferase
LKEVISNNENIIIDFKDKFTDEASVVETFGMKVHLVEGEENNIKITNPIDMLLAEYLLSQRTEEKA